MSETTETIPTGKLDALLSDSALLEDTRTMLDEVIVDLGLRERELMWLASRGEATEADVERTRHLLESLRYIRELS